MGPLRAAVALLASLALARSAAAGVSVLFSQPAPAFKPAEFTHAFALANAANITLHDLGIGKAHP